MAEHLNQEIEPISPGWNAMGKPISAEARQAGYEHCKTMGLESGAAWSAVIGTAEQLERDKPYEAQGAAMKYLDLTGAYRLMAVLLTEAAKPIPAAEEKSPNP